MEIELMCLFELLQTKNEISFEEFQYYVLVYKKCLHSDYRDPILLDSIRILLNEMKVVYYIDNADDYDMLKDILNSNQMSR